MHNDHFPQGLNSAVRSSSCKQLITLLHSLTSPTPASAAYANSFLHMRFLPTRQSGLNKFILFANYIHHTEYLGFFPYNLVLFPVGESVLPCNAVCSKNIVSTVSVFCNFRLWLISNFRSMK